MLKIIKVASKTPIKKVSKNLVIKPVKGNTNLLSTSDIYKIPLDNGVVSSKHGFIGKRIFCAKICTFSGKSSMPDKI